jgi:preprotein translocase subunit SecG
MIFKVFLVAHILVTIALIAMVMIQTGKGAEAGAAFGGGASSTVFGSSGAGNFLTRTTGILATLFFVTSLSLAVLSGQGEVKQSATEVAEPTAPTAPVPAAPDTGIIPPATGVIPGPAGQ